MTLHVTRLLPLATFLAAACSSAANDGGNPDAGGPGLPPHSDGGQTDGGINLSHDGGGQDGATDSAADGGTTPPPSCTPSWTVTAACGGLAGGAAPDFGPNVFIFDPSQGMSQIQGKLDATYGAQDDAQFGNGRYAYFFKPGAYSLDVKVGFYTHVVGLGQSPDAVTITGDRFEFAGDFRGLEVLREKGTLIGRDGGREVRTPYPDCVLVMPSRRLTRGQTAVRLGRYEA